MAANLTTYGPTGGVAFSAQPSSGQTSIALAQIETVVLGSEQFDIGSNFASNTFTAPVTGKYQLNFVIRVDDLDTAATYYQTYLITSNKTYYTTIWPKTLGNDTYDDPDYWNLATQAIVAEMDANDTATIGVYQLGGTQQTDITTETTFSGFLVS